MSSKSALRPELPAPVEFSIKSWCIRTGTSQGKLALALGVSRETICRLARTPRLTRVWALAILAVEAGLEEKL